MLDFYLIKDTTSIANHSAEKFPVPVNRSGENFSPIPEMAPPPEGSDIGPDADLLLILPFSWHSSIINS